MLPQPITAAPATESADARSRVLDEIDRRAKAIRALRHAGALFVQAAVLAGLLALFCLRVPQVDGHSMAPQIEDGDRVLIDTVAYDARIQSPGADGGALMDVHLHPIARGDIVAFTHGQGDDRRVYLKRAIAFGGETVAMTRGVVSVDGVVLSEPYRPLVDATDLAPTRVPPGSIFVLGDNRGDSDDSRSFGPVDSSAVIGRALLVVWPVPRVRTVR